MTGMSESTRTDTVNDTEAELVGADKRGVVITSSSRAAAGVYPDRSGPVIVERLQSWGFSTGEPIVVADGDEFGLTLRDVLASEPDLVITTGGTGLTPTDVTPEQTMPLLDRLVPGIAEGMRAAGVAKGVPTAMLSRGLVGISGQSLVVNLPGSRGGVSDGLDVLEQVLEHVLQQLPGGDH
ncbi:MAG TPA: MogA/MoaB family molybdenum cofactor biosynthesis protein [Intrasporangium sp.]